MDMNKAFILKREDRNPDWRVIDASGKILGRLATEVADALRGKDKPDYTPHTDGGDYVVITNCQNIVLTGAKMDDKIYQFHSGWQGGLKELSAKEMMKKDATSLIYLAVKRMLPRNKLSRQIIKKLKIYAGDTHPHKAQVKVQM